MTMLCSFRALCVTSTHQACCALGRPSCDVGDVKQPVVQQRIRAGLGGGTNECIHYHTGIVLKILTV